MKNEKMESSIIFKMLGRNIRKAMLAKNLSQENLSNDLDKTLNFVSLIENGKTGLSIPTLVDIGRVLNVNADTLFEGVIPLADYSEEKFIVDTVRMLNEKDRKAVVDFLTYIVESKT